MFFGWWMVAVAFLAQGMSSGSTTYLFGLFVKPVAEEFAAQRGPISLGMSLLTLAQGLIAPFLGVALDRRSIRATMTLGALAMGGGFALMAAAPSLPTLGACFATLIAFGSLAIGPLSASKLVANWFEATRGRALGVASTGTSAGGAVLPPLAAWAIAAWGWRGALAALGGLVVALLLPAVWLLVRNRPEDRGLTLDGAGTHRAAPAAAATPPAPALGLPQLLRQRNFWALGMAVGLVFALLGALLVNLHPYATDLGADAAAGAWLFTLLSVSGIAGKLAFGALADRVSKRLLMAVGMAMLAGFLLLLLTEPDYELLAWACALVGLALGGFLPIWGALIGECWGREAFARVMGLMSPLMSPLVMAAVAVPGFVHDRTGSYALAFQIFLVALALAGVALALLRVPKRPTSEPV